MGAAFIYGLLFLAIKNDARLPNASSRGSIIAGVTAFALETAHDVVTGNDRIESFVTLLSIVPGILATVLIMRAARRQPVAGLGPYPLPWTLTGRDPTKSDVPAGLWRRHARKSERTECGTAVQHSNRGDQRWLQRASGDIAHAQRAEQPWGSSASVITPGMPIHMIT